MGVARLLAKAWGVFCVFAGAYALQRALAAGAPLVPAASAIAICCLLFGAMGFLFAAGYGISGRSARTPLMRRIKPDSLAPGFNEIVFVVFAFAIFFVQTSYLPTHVTGGILGALQEAVHFAVPGQRALQDRLDACSLDGGRGFAAAFAWILAFIFLGSAVSRIRLGAAVVRLERQSRPEPLGATALVVLLGLLAAVAIQMLFMGSVFDLLPCDVLIDIPGQFMIGLGPLMLAYLIVAALTDLLALGPQA